MSYILDALRRSEQERARADLPLQAVLGLGAPAVGRRRWLLWAAAGAVAINLAALAWLLRQPSQQPAPATVAAGPASPVSAPAPSLPPLTSPVSLAELAGSQNTVPLLLPAAATPEPAAAKPAAAMAYAPELASLPESFRRGVPPIPVSIHVYAADAAARFVMVNLRRYGEGAELPGGPRIERITPDGLILLYQGQRFHLQVR